MLGEGRSCTQMSLRAVSAFLALFLTFLETSSFLYRRERSDFKIELQYNTALEFPTPTPQPTPTTPTNYPTKTSPVITINWQLKARPFPSFPSDPPVCLRSSHHTLITVPFTARTSHHSPREKKQKNNKSPSPYHLITALVGFRSLLIVTIIGASRTSHD
jgi:hypothetical protein